MTLICQKDVGNKGSWSLRRINISQVYCFSRLKLLNPRKSCYHEHMLSFKGENKKQNKGKDWVKIIKADRVPVVIKHNSSSHALGFSKLIVEVSPYMQHLCDNQLWKMHIKHNWDKGIHYPNCNHLTLNWFSRMPLREATKFDFSNTINTEICKENCPLVVQTEVKKGSNTTQIELFLTPWQEYNFIFCYTYKAIPANNK